MFFILPVIASWLDPYLSLFIPDLDKKVTDGERMVAAIKGVIGKRLTYRPVSPNCHSLVS